MINLSDNEAKVLERLSEGGGEWFWPFAPIEADTGLSRDEVRSACRSLREKGLATFSNTLWNEDEHKPAGSGYRITPEGFNAWRLIEARRKFPVGSAVRYWPVLGEDEPVEAEVRSEPWALGHGAIVVKITGKTGGVLVSHLDRLDGTGRPPQ